MTAIVPCQLVGISTRGNAPDRIVKAGCWEDSAEKPPIGRRQGVGRPVWGGDRPGLRGILLPAVPADAQDGRQPAANWRKFDNPERRGAPLVCQAVAAQRLRSPGVTLTALGGCDLDLRWPALERFCLGAGDGMDQAENAFGVPALEFLRPTGRRELQGKGGTNCPPPSRSLPKSGSRLRNFLPIIGRIGGICQGGDNVRDDKPPLAHVNNPAFNSRFQTGWKAVMGARSPSLDRNSLEKRGVKRLERSSGPNRSMWSSAAPT